MTSITISADYDHLSLAYDLVEAQAIKLGLNERDVYDIKLATDEAVTNIIRHGYRDNAGKVHIDVEQVGDALAIILTDYGRLFDPTQKESPDLTVPLNKRKKGGMGVFLMKKNMDILNYQVTEEGANKLTMIKLLNKKG